MYPNRSSYIVAPYFRLLSIFALLTTAFVLVVEPAIPNAATIKEGYSKTQQTVSSISLDGKWKFCLDSADAGKTQSWWKLEYDDSIQIPGTTDLAGFGQQEIEPFAGRLSREHKYIGAAWYQRTINIPHDWTGRNVELFLERVIWKSEVWIDGTFCGAQDSLATPHVHRLGKLAPGRHTLTVRIDNRMIHPIGDQGGSYTDSTQTIWNGMVGRCELRPVNDLSIELLRIFPAAEARHVDVEITLINAKDTACSATIDLYLHERESEDVLESKRFVLDVVPGINVMKLSLKCEFVPKLWDEYSPNLYVLKVSVGNADSRLNMASVFGFRTIRRKGKHLFINNRPVFIRGNIDNAQYPLTGHPPLDIENWRRTLKICRDYGMNQVRFHSWCPPEAAFQAADELGIYLQPEVVWIVPDRTIDPVSSGRLSGIGLGDTNVDSFILAEMRRILNTYGNHPSFCFFVIGNELGSSNFNVMGQWIAEEKKRDPRRLYAASTARTITPFDDFSDTHLIPGVGPVVNNLGVPSTDWDYQKSYGQAPVPIIAHEMGQIPVYPKWSESDKYVGPVRARNYESMAKQAKERGVFLQSEQLQQASGAMNRIIYKNEMEAQLRSKDCAGVSWLSMQDYPGQGEALVGWLNSFYQNKGFTTPKQFRRFCGPTVPLARFKKYVWSSDEKMSVVAEVAHWGSQPLQHAVFYWVLRDSEEKVIENGEFKPVTVAIGGVTELGRVEIDLKGFQRAWRLNFEIYLPETQVANDWNVWVFPSVLPRTKHSGVLVTTNSTEVWDALSHSKNVLFLAHELGNHKYSNWMPIFWSTRYFSGQGRATLGSLVHADHPALANFPTDAHLDWQWLDICECGSGFVLDAQPASFFPIVQPVCDFHDNHKLGTIFEFTSDSGGKLLVCGYDLVHHLDHRPASRWLRQCLLNYASSDFFKPKTKISFQSFHKLFPVEFRLNAQEFLKYASHATIDWPGHPGWKYISRQNDRLELCAHKPDESEQTTIIIPLVAGKYRLRGSILLRKECQFQAVLTGSISGQPSPLFVKSIRPGIKTELDQEFRLSGSVGDFVLKYYMVPGATNSHSSNLSISQFELEKSTSELMAD